MNLKSLGAVFSRPQGFVLPRATSVFFVPQNGEVLRYFFGQLQVLQDQGIIAGATQGEVYDTCVAWNR